MFFFLIIPTLLLADLYWWSRADLALRRLPHARIWRIALALFMSVQVAYMASLILAGIFYPGISRSTFRWIPVFLLAVIYLWHLLILPLSLLTLILSRLVQLARRAIRYLRHSPATNPVSPTISPEDPPLTRRQFVAALATLPPALSLATAGFSLPQLHQFRINSVHLQIPDLPLPLEGLTIAHLSDIHVGRWTRPGFLPAVTDATNRLKADLVLLTGDLIDLSLSDLPVALDMVRQLDPRFGLVMCEGNHDLIDSRKGFESAVKSSTIPLLLDESQFVYYRNYPIQLLGTRWAHSDTAIAQSIQRLLPQRQSFAFPILLAHHPHTFDPAAHARFPLILSGHTHGGQLMLTDHFGPGPVMFRYYSGLYRRPHSSLFVSNGVGNWFPIRINAPAEIVHLTLHRA